MIKLIRFRTLAPLVLVFISFSCTEIQTADKKPAQDIEVHSQDNYLSGQELLPEPDPEDYKSILNGSKSKSSGRLYEQILVYPKGAAAGSHGAPVVNNFADAIARVKPNGTIRVFKGEYEIAQPVVIDRAVTIKPMSGASPMIRNTGVHAFLVSGIEDGTVTFEGLSFENAGGHSSIAVQGAEVLITGSAFDAGNGTAGVFAQLGARVTIQTSSFTNGSVGTFASGENTKLMVHTSSFSSHGLVAVQHQLSADGVVSGNTMTDCGLWRCASAVGGSQVDMINNRFSGDITNSEVDGFFHHIVMYSASTGRVADNLFDGCGHGQCVTSINQSVLEVSNNEFKIYENQNTRIVIVVSDGTGGQDPFGREAKITAINNVITGIGGNAESDSGNPNAYAIKLAGLLVENLGTMEAYGNSIENANMGIAVMNGGILSSGQNNSVRNIRSAVSAYNWGGLGAPLAILRSNDFSNYVTALETDGFDTESDLTCNWWGSVNGPRNPATGISSFYTPWSVEPVAGSSVTGCTGVL